MISRLSLTTLLAGLMLMAANTGAQDAGTDSAAQADENSVAAETNDSTAVANPDKEDADSAAEEADEEADASRPVNASTDVFIPTEEVSVDRSISMPVDI